MKALLIILVSLSALAVSELSAPAVKTQINSTQGLTSGVELYEKDSKKSVFKVSLVNETWSYEEFNTNENDKKIMEDSGTLRGVELLYVKKWDLISLEGLYKYVSGDTKYDGSLQATYSDGTKEITPYSSPSQNKIQTARILMSFNLIQSSKSQLGLKLGYQYRKLFNQEQANDPYDYSREAIYKTIPFGLGYSFSFSKLSMDITYLAHFGFSGQTTSFASSARNENRIYIQEEGSGSRISLDFNYKISKTLKLSTGVFYEKWDIEDSEMVRLDRVWYSLEPRNTTAISGLQVGLLF